MRDTRWFDSAAIYIVILGALGAGLAAAYGRELEANRAPDRNWWLRRLLIIPLLAIAATAATEAFRLPGSLAAFSAAMLSLGGYDALRLVETRWKQRIEAVARAGQERKARPEGGADAVLPRE